MTIVDILYMIEESGLEILKVVEVDVDVDVNVSYVRLSSDLTLKVEFRYDVPEFILARWKEDPPFDYLSWPDNVYSSEFDGLCVGLEPCNMSSDQWTRGGNLIFLQEFDWLLSVIKRMLA